MFLEKYKPKAVVGMLGNRMQTSELKRLITTWKKGTAIVLSGPPGCGKTLAVELVAREMGFEIISGAVDDLVASGAQTSMWNRGKLLTGDMDADMSIDDADNLTEKSMWPVVLLTTDIYQRNLSELRKDSRIQIIQFQKIGISELANFLSRLCATENIAFDDKALLELAKRSDGDVRWALMALESLKIVDINSVQELDKDRIERIFEMLDAIFQRKADDIDIESHFAWIIENLADKYNGKELAQAYDCTTNASRFLRFGFDNYAQEFLKLMPISHTYSKYNLPRWINKRSLKIDGIHCSAKKAKSYSQVFNKLQDELPHTGGKGDFNGR